MCANSTPSEEKTPAEHEDYVVTSPTMSNKDQGTKKGLTKQQEPIKAPLMRELLKERECPPLPVDEDMILWSQAYEKYADTCGAARSEQITRSECFTNVEKKYLSRWGAWLITQETLCNESIQYKLKQYNCDLPKSIAGVDDKFIKLLVEACESQLNRSKAMEAFPDWLDTTVESLSQRDDDKLVERMTGMWTLVEDFFVSRGVPYLVTDFNKDADTIRLTNGKKIVNALMGSTTRLTKSSVAKEMKSFLDNGHGLLQEDTVTESKKPVVPPNDAVPCVPSVFYSVALEVLMIDLRN